MEIAADVAITFHWQPSEIAKLESWELQHYQKLALERMKALYGRV
jgi:hypothetical protein